MCWTVLPALFDSREPASELRLILKRTAKRARCQARKSLYIVRKCAVQGSRHSERGGAALDNRRHGRFGNGREPRVLWKIHAAFIAILLQTGGGSEWKDRDSTGDVTMSCPPTLFLSFVNCSRGHSPIAKPLKRSPYKQDGREVSCHVTLGPHFRQLYEELRAVWRICARVWVAS